MTPMRRRIRAARSSSSAFELYKEALRLEKAAIWGAEGGGGVHKDNDRIRIRSNRTDERHEEGKEVCCTKKLALAQSEFLKR